MMLRLGCDFHSSGFRFAMGLLNPVLDDAECCNCNCNCDCGVVDVCFEADLRRMEPAPLSELRALVVEFLAQPAPTDLCLLEEFILSDTALTADAGLAERDESTSMLPASVPVADATVEMTWARALASSSALHSLADDDATLRVLGSAYAGGGVTADPKLSDGLNALLLMLILDTERRASGAKVTGPSARATCMAAGEGRSSASL